LRLGQATGYETALFGKAGCMPLPLSLNPKLLPGGGAAESGPWVLETMRSHPNERRQPGTSEGEFLETFIVNRTLAWLRSRPASEARAGVSPPWFVHVSFLSPHGPNTVPVGFDSQWSPARRPAPLPLPRQDAVFPGDRILLPAQTVALLGIDEPPASSAARGDGSKENPGGHRFFGEDTASSGELDEHRRRYYGQASYVDAQIGRLLSATDVVSAGSTLVVLTSDHGSMLYDHGLPDKHTLHAVRRLRPGRLRCHPHALPVFRVPRLIRRLCACLLSFAGPAL